MYMRNMESRREVRKEKRTWSRSGERKEKSRSEVRKEKGNWSMEWRKEGKEQE